jgi:hypothetical protein
MLLCLGKGGRAIGVGFGGVGGRERGCRGGEESRGWRRKEGEGREHITGLKAILEQGAHRLWSKVLRKIVDNWHEGAMV